MGARGFGARALASATTSTKPHVGEGQPQHEIELPNLLLEPLQISPVLDSIL